MVLAPVKSDPAVSWKQLSPHRQRLLALIESVQYGRIERLLIRGKEPVDSPDTRIIRTVKFGKPSSVRSIGSDQDFVLKREIVEFLSYIDRVRDGLILRIEIAAGQPRLLEIEESCGL